LSEPIGILYCIDALPPTGGTEVQLAGLLERLDRSRFRPHLCTTRPDQPLRALPDDVTHLSLSVPKLFSRQAWHESRRFGAHARHHDIAIVQTFFQDATVFGLWSARLAGVPVRIASFRDLGFWREPKIEFLMRRSYPNASAFLVNSAAVRDHFVSADRLSPERFHVIPNGMDVDAFEFATDRDDPPRVVLVGNLNRPVKRADLFVQACAAVAETVPAARWQIVGDGQLRSELEALAQELGVANRVEFLGRLADVSPVLAGATVGVNCSDSEGFSNAVLEYMLAGSAVVATDVGGNRELVEDGETGLLVPVGDAEALGDRIARLIDDPGLVFRMAVRARQRVHADFAWPSSVARHEQLYLDLLGR
jgi:glycosyltransferase involved in cell wall biosynthesis